MKRNTEKLVKIGYQEIALIDQESTFQNTFDSYGEFDHRKNTITISKDLSDLDYSCTLIHEIVHAVCYYYGLTQSGQPLDTENKEEIVVNNISNGLTSVLKENPFILKLLANKLNVR